MERSRSIRTQRRRAAAVPPTPCDHVARGYFALGDWSHEVRVTSSADFLLYVWARNVETSPGALQVTTPASQFRGGGSSGPDDGLALDVAAQTGIDLGCIGAQKGESIGLISATGGRLRVFLTVATANGATVSMTAT